MKEEPLVSLIYVSLSTVPPAERRAEVNQIVMQSVAHNATIGVTGALMSTSRYFAQLLEGRAAVVDRLLARIRLDTRHRDLAVVRRRRLDERQFAGWSLAYSGSSTTLDDMLQSLARIADDAAVDALVMVMTALAVPVAG